MKSRTRTERAHARVEQHKRRGSFTWARLTDNGDIVTLLPLFTVEVTETMWKNGSKLRRCIVGTLRFHTATVSATPGSDVQLPEGYPVIVDFREESDALRTVHGRDSTAPNPPPPIMMVGGSRLRWEGLDGEDGVVCGAIEACEGA
eukprot:CAMPEP_0177791894 /NCGR_PEP_ID=MMETSP0491_2-20121128/24203_1 /TAXON_ID=63592 /ORGANISM="Tetraselmis chuii, Strain PLY429" /LENGTH=145 /DNA_ID=CAMNT_0019314209 /DNA_START=1299 /DNA_END=1736 /DNA_ORIENTATION=-